MSTPSATAGFVGVDTTSLKTITLPLCASREGRVITFKDRTGNAGANPITFITQGSDTFERGAKQYIMNVVYGSVTFISRGSTWLVMNAYGQGFSLSTGNLYTSSVNFIDTTIGYGYTGNQNLLSVSSGTLLLNNNYITGSATTVSQIIAGTNITVSPAGGTGIVTINGASLSNLVSTANLVSLVSTSYLATQLGSTVVGLGTAGYVSTSQLLSTSLGLTPVSYTHLTLPTKRIV